MCVCVCVCGSPSLTLTRSHTHTHSLSLSLSLSPLLPYFLPSFPAIAQQTVLGLSWPLSAPTRTFAPCKSRSFSSAGYVASRIHLRSRRELLRSGDAAVEQAMHSRAAAMMATPTHDMARPVDVACVAVRMLRERERERERQRDRERERERERETEREKERERGRNEVLL